MTSIHPTAVIAPGASLDSDVKIGPFCVVEDRVSIGAGCRLEAHAVVKSDTRIGANNFVGESAVLGAAPQHAKCPEEVGTLVVGDGNTFRENVTVHRALNVGSTTTLGDGSLLMVNAHVGHDCIVGNQVIVANNVMLAGHVTVSDRAYISGAVGVHQFCRIGWAFYHLPVSHQRHSLFFEIDNFDRIQIVKQSEIVIKSLIMGKKLFVKSEMPFADASGYIAIVFE